MRDNTNVARNMTQHDGKHGSLEGQATLSGMFQIAHRPDVKEHLDLPYKGLNPYTETDTNIFFGREQDIQNIVNNLLAWRLTILYGKSGVGKSSALRAGVASILNEEARQNLSDYRVPKLALVVFPSLEKDFSWKDDPLVSLMTHIKNAIVNSGWNIQPPEPGLSFVETLRGWTDGLGGEAGNGELYLILDQFEEYFLYHPEERGEGTFFTEFPRAANCSHLRVNFLISIREDAIADLDRFQPQIPNLLEHRLSLGYLDGQAGKEAITQPIEYYNQQHGTAINIEPSLVDMVLEEVQVGKVVLSESGIGGIDTKPKTLSEMQIETPYLQLVMERLWKEEVENKKSDLLRIETFKALGKADQIVKDHLNHQMQLLTGNEKKIAVSIFRYLVTPSGNKCACSVRDLSEYTRWDKIQIKQLLDKLTSGERRIVRPVGSAKHDQPDTQRYEIFHDALAKAILNWCREHSRYSQLVKLIVVSVLITFLLVGSIAALKIGQLGRDLRITEQRLIGIDAVQRADTSSQLIALQDAIKVVQTVQAQKLQRAVPAVTLSLQQILSSIQEQNQFQALAVKGGTTKQAVLSPTGDLAATTFFDGTVSVWTLKGEKLIDFKAHDGLLCQISFLEDGKRLAIAAMDGTVAIWDVQGNRLTEFKLPKDAGWGVSFSSDGQHLATSDLKGSVGVWTLAGKKVVEFHAHEGWSFVSFSPDGQRLATFGQDDVVRLWDLQGNQLAELKGHQGAIYFVKFEPKEQKLVTGGQDGTIRMWNLKGQELKQFSQEKGSVYYLGISPDGERVATASAGGVVRLWDKQGNWLAELKGHENLVTDISFSQNGKHLATVTSNGTVRVWNLQDKQGFQAYTRALYSSQIRFKPDGQSLVTVAEQGISQWDLEGNRFTTKRGNVLTSFFSKDGHLRFVTTVQDFSKEIDIWDFQ